MIKAKVIADSRAYGKALTTLELTYPRYIHAELLTHRVFSRNAASSRAIPIDKMISRVLADTVIPCHWGRNQPGMQADSEIDLELHEDAEYIWRNALLDAISSAKALSTLGVHKQVVNRLLEPFMHITTIVTATEWNNFFNLRLHNSAQPEMQELAASMNDAINCSVPEQLAHGDWHLPYVLDTEFSKYDTNTLKKISVARCARVSYLNHDGTRDIEKDLSLHDKLFESKHMSPFEHVATPSDNPDNWANFQDWQQYRWELENR